MHQNGKVKLREKTKSNVTRGMRMFQKENVIALH